jgi:cell division protein FtsI/penicillin-binding protein 2
MPTHCTSSMLNRRDFLKFLLALGGLLYRLNGRSPAIVPRQSTWHEPVWMWDLQTGRIRGPRQDFSHSSLIPSVPYGLPGSIMKLVAATALSEEHLIQPHQKLECAGHIHLKGQRYVCQHAHGRLTLQEAIGHSCNVFFAQAVQTLSASRFLYYARRFELHQPVVAGHPFRFEHHAAAREPVQMLALGLSPQIQPNALQLLRLAHRIAQRAIPNIAVGTWEILQGGMRIAARQGTAHALDPVDGFKIAAKTGTAPHGEKFDAWLIGYFPFDNPRFAFCVRAARGTAKDSAVPLARDFLARKGWS